MNRISRPTLIFLIALFFITPCFVLAQDIFTKEQAKRFLADHEFLIDEALVAYNEEDYRRFYTHFASGRLSKTSKAFKVIWIEGYKAKYGNFLSKKLLRDKCSFNDMYPLLVYRAEFEKNKNIIIKASFTREGRLYKIFYMRFDPES